MDVRETHPTPQFARTEWLDLGGEWQFAYDDDDRGVRHRWFDDASAFDRTIVVPYPPESPASGIGNTGVHEVVWYRRTFRLPAGRVSTRWRLHFGAVDYAAKVWINGRVVAEHSGGHTPFHADIEMDVNDGDVDQVVVVRAEDRLDMAQPRGKQDWQPEPHKIWYARTTGIWQPVWLEPLSDLNIERLVWTPDLDNGLLVLHAVLNRQPEQGTSLHVQLSLNGEPLADDTYALTGRDVRRAIALDAGRHAMEREDYLWSPYSPNLVDAVLRVVDSGGTVLDEVFSYAGLRTCGFADGRFLLNSRPFYLRLVLAQNFWPESHLAAPNGDALRREVELAKSLGFNGVRIHQKVEDPRFLYWCDKLGMLVWGEMANAYIFTPEAVAALTREWLDVVRRDISAPCIVTWVPLNESWGVPSLPSQPAQRDFVRALYSLTHALDPTRPVIGNDGWEHVVSDVWGVHDYEQDPEVLRQRYGSPEAVDRTIREVQPYYRSIGIAEAHRAGEPVMLTECGGITDAPREGEQWFGYGHAGDAESLLSTYTALIDTIVQAPTIAGFCYTQLTDTQQESNGLLTELREPKVDPEHLRAVTTRPSSAVPGEALDQMRVQSQQETGSAVRQGHG